jgi:hypothetical protein
MSKRWGGQAGSEESGETALLEAPTGGCGTASR